MSADREDADTTAGSDPSPPSWAAVAQVLDQALAAEPAARLALARELCGDDATLAAEVASLLAAHARADGFLERGAAAGYAASIVTASQAALEDAHGRLVGRWRLVEEIGRGGMGTVWLAERADGQFEQRVAVKLVRRGMDTHDIRARFLHERRILARLAHPNITRLLDGDVSEDGRPFFVMEHVAGTRITDFCDAQRATVERRLELFLVVCRAVQHAHRSLVVHSDLKPSNVLVTDKGEVKLVDFGIATLLADDGEEAPTRVGSARVTAMTPEYAAPEQLRAQPASTATDVYQLGVLLYELLAGRRPFELRHRTLLEVERAICHTDPPRLSAACDDPQLARRLRGDLDAIVETAMRKEPEHRYPSAEALADEIAAHLEGRPVRARGAAFGYVAGRFLRRHRAAVAAGAAFALLAIGFFAVYTSRVRAERDRVRVEARKASASSELLARFFQNWSPEGYASDRRGARALLDAEARQLELAGPASGEVGAAVESLLGQLYLELGEPDVAQRLLERAEAAQLAARPRSVPDLAATTTRLGILALERDRVAEAERRLRRAVALWDSLGEAADPRRVDAGWGLARVLFRDRRYEDAAREAARAVAPWEGQELVPPNVAAVRHLHAQALFNLGRFAEAERDLRDILAAWDRLSPDDDAALWARRVLSSVLRDQGRLAEAETTARDALARSVRKYGSDDARTQTANLVLALVLQRRGRFAEADIALREALATYERMPTERLLLADALQALANLRIDQGAVAAGERLLRRSRELFGEALTGRDPDLGDHLNRLAYILLLRGDPEGPEVYRQALDFHRQRPRDEPLFVTDGLHYLAWSMRHQGDLAESEALYRQALVLYRRSLDPSHPYLAESLSGLGDLLAVRGRAGEAEPLLAESVACWRRRQAAVGALAPHESEAFAAADAALERSRTPHAGALAAR
jgi:serine/threonine-protein kinase